jgi:hypothetical protein
VAALLGLASASSAGPILDPMGDQFPGAGVGPDIVAYSAELLLGPPRVVAFSVTFKDPISPPSAGQPNSILGFIDLDTDKNGATGGNAAFGYTPPGGASWINFGVDNGFLAGPPIGLGAEFFVELGSEAGGFVSVVNAFTNVTVGAVPIGFSANGFSLTIPLSLLGNPAEPYFNYGLVVGDLNGSADRAPNGSAAAVITPEPASAILFGLVGAATAGVGYRRRRAAA